jgi:hypothetical protein
MDIRSLIILLPILIVPWIAVYILFISSNRKVISNFKKLADKYSFQTDFSKKIGMKTHPSASGVYRNRNIHIESIIRDSLDGKKIIPHTVITAECSNPNNFYFAVVKRNKKNTLNFQNGSHLTGDNEFDNNFIIKTNDINKLNNILDFNTKFKLDRVLALGFNGIVILEGNFIKYIDSGLLNSDEALMRAELMLHEICDISDVLKFS